MASFETRLFINNESREFLTVYNPTDGTLLSDQIHAAGEADVDAAVGAAQAAFRGAWGQMDPTARAAALFKFAGLVRAHAEALGLLDTRAMGSAIATQSMAYGQAADLLQYYAGLADKIYGEASYPTSAGQYRIIQKEPIGVCAGIGGWNVSAILFAWKVAPALAAGNTYVFKPSEKAPLGALALGPLIRQCFPPGTVNIVNGTGATGQLLASHMAVRQIGFTGSTATGRKIQESAARSNLKRVSLELGGKSPSLVFADADLDHAVARTVAGLLVNTGQICAMTSRIFVQDTVADAFTSRLKAALQTASTDGTIGDPTRKETKVGPVADEAQFRRVLAYLAIGKQDCELVCGGGRRGDVGFFVEPTVFRNPAPGSRLLREEVFGPVVTVQAFGREDEAVARANDSDFGLSASVYTGSVARALRVTRALEAGTVAVNDFFFPAADSPFGGVKQSGYGREGGVEGLHEYLQTKTIQIK